MIALQRDLDAKRAALSSLEKEYTNGENRLQTNRDYLAKMRSGDGGSENDPGS